MMMKEALRERALAEGFSSMGICAPDAVPEAAGRLGAFLDAGRHGQMAWISLGTLAPTLALAWWCVRRGKARV